MKIRCPYCKLIVEFIKTSIDLGVYCMCPECEYDMQRETYDRMEQLERDLAAAREWIAKQPCKHKLASWNPDKILEGGGKGGIEKFDCGKCQPCVERKRKVKDGND